MSPRRPPVPSVGGRAPSLALPGQVRLIGGHWRGSKLPVPPLPGLRPTSDRVRETLFNWLQPELAGARVLDLFAGSGALGFEAASRGAAQVDLVEAMPVAAASLRETATKLGRDGSGRTIEVHARTAAAFLAEAAGEGRIWDIVFVDPPFADGLWPQVLAALRPCLALPAWVYVESPAVTPADVPASWRRHRELRSRDAHAGLYRVDTD